MKKIFYVLQVASLGALLSPVYVFAGNAALIAGVYDDEIMRVVTISEVRPEPQIKDSLFLDTSGENSNLVIEVSGVLERLDKKNNPEANSTPTRVTSEKDLVDYIKALVRNNVNFTLVSVKEDAVSITRETPTKLFGVLDISSQETAEVISWGDGTSAVSVTRPWWSVFTKYDTRRDVVTNNLYVRMKDVSPALLTTNLSASTKARLIQEIQAAFEENTTKSNLSVE